MPTQSPSTGSKTRNAALTRLASSMRPSPTRLPTMTAQALHRPMKKTKPRFSMVRKIVRAA